MHQVKTIFIFCIFIFLLSFRCVFANGIKSELRGDFVQGSVIFVTIKGVNENSVGNASLDGKIFPLSNYGSELMGTISIPLDSPEGEHKIFFLISDGKEESKFERTISVKSKTYGIQHLYLSDSQLSSYDDPQADRDNDAILDALKKCSDNIKWTNNFIRPVDGAVTTLFGLKRFYNQDPEPEFHKGVDIAGFVGKKIVAPQNGIVLMAKNNLILHGGTVVLSHGRGIGTIYLHLDSVTVSEGQIVKQGDLIGYMGEKGVSTAPHLHWAAYANSFPIDPWKLMKLPSSWLSR